MGEPICKIARENGGEVPLNCLFGCSRGCADDLPPYESPHALRCKKCGSTDVRWRQQGGKWVLFSLKPGVVHTCELKADDFPDLA